MTEENVDVTVMRQLISEGMSTSTKMRDALIETKAKLKDLNNIHDQVLVLAAKEAACLTADDRRIYETVQGNLSYVIHSVSHTMFIWLKFIQMIFLHNANWYMILINWFWVVIGLKSYLIKYHATISNKVVNPTLFSIVEYFIRF